MNRFDCSFSASAETVIGVLLGVIILATAVAAFV